MIKFESTSPTGSDCTTAYDVETDCKTIGDVVNEFLKRGEWGYFKIGSWSGEKYEYKGSKMLMPMPQGLLSRRIGKIQASGGWSNMNYCFR